MITKPKVVTVYEDMWGPERLMAFRGLCCLGFLCHKQHPTVRLVTGDPINEPVAEHGFLTDGRGLEFTRGVMDINDDDSIDQPTRKRRLRQKFRENGIRLIFRKTAPKGFRARVEKLVGHAIKGMYARQ